MSHLAKDMTPDVTWKDITPGCNIYEGGTSSVVETGDWRTMKPVIDWDKCRQCLLCAPVCREIRASSPRPSPFFFFTAIRFHPLSQLLLLQGLRHLRQHLPLRGHHYGQGREIRRGRNNGNQRKTFRQ